MCQEQHSSEQQSEGMSSSAIKIYYKIIVIKTAWFWCRQTRPTKQNKEDQKQTHAHMHTWYVFKWNYKPVGNEFNKWLEPSSYTEGVKSYLQFMPYTF